MARHSQQRAIIKDFGVFDAYVPPSRSQRPSAFTSAYFKLIRKQLQHTFQNAYCMMQLKLKVPGSSRINLSNEGKRLYEEMNKAFARNDVEGVHSVCCDTLASHLKREIKSRVSGKHLTSSKYSYSTSDLNADVQSLRAGVLASGYTIAQIILRIQGKEKMRLIDTVSGNVQKEKEKDVDEYIVLQKHVEDASDKWKVYGKLTPEQIQYAQQHAMQA